MDKQIYIQDVPSIELGGQTYTVSDNSLIASFNTDITFNSETDYIEYFIYNANKELIDSVEHLRNFAIYGEDLSINPEQDLESRAYLEGKYYTVYNFLRPLLSSSILEPYYVSKISTDRTELRLSSTSILGGDIVDSVTALKLAIETSPFQKDFSLNFNQNNLVIANNVLLDDSNPDNITVLVKLYEPLPEQFGIQSQCWAVEKIAESKAFLIDVIVSYTQEDTTIKIKGPNINLQQNTEINKSGEYQNTTALKSTTNNNLKYQLNSILAETGVELNIDYTDYNNFVFFSSAQTRLENFYYKLGLIEEYTVSASYGTGNSNYYTSESVNYWDAKIDEIITNFDGYEYFLYYESGSTAWPKSNSTPPFQNAPTTSSIGLTWIANQSTVAETYDENNKDALVSTIPLYIREDSDNADFELFVEMVGQHFDSIWVYTQAVTEKYNSDNRVETGLSKDLIGTALKDFGIKLYQNNFTSDNLYNTYLGYTPSGSLLPYTGQELITTYVTASATGSLIPIDNLSSEIYKRLYHNLPYLLKKKGTVEGLNTLITTFGIPDTILRVYEYGGKDQNINTFDQWQQQYDLTFVNTGSSYVTSSFQLNSTWGAVSNRPSAVEFRFKTEGIPATTHYSQSLWSTDNGSTVLLRYTGSAFTSGSYSGSVVNPYNQYGVLEFYPSSSNTTVTASIYLPFFDGGWWSILVNKNSSTGFTVYAKNSLYNGNDGNTLGFQASSSVSLANPWITATEAYLGKSSLSSKVFSGSLQELRYYTQPISESTFDAYVMNPGSIEQSQFLAFRAALGGELYTASISIHPKVSGEQTTTSSFAATSNFYITGSTTYSPNVSTVFYDQPIAGIKNAVSNKVKVGTTDVYGTVLSGLNTLQQNYVVSQSYTRDVNYLEVGFSPQNEINEDINSQFGYFNIGEYIGDPRFISESSYRYPALDTLSLDYFKKYTSSYNYTDYLRLLKFFDNSLFRLIKDFIPARTAAATGAIVKQHLLERNRQRPAQVDYTQPEYTGSFTSLARDYQTGSIEVFTGGAGGSVNVLTNISQSWTSSILTKAGLVTEIESSEYEFYNGEYSGSSIDAINNQLQDNPLLGAAYRVGIPDLQNLDVKSAALIISASIQNPISLTYFSTGSYPFNNLQKTILYYNTSNFEYKPNFSIQSDININITGSISGSGPIYINFLTTNLLKDGVEILTDILPLGSPSNFTHNISYPNLYLISGSTYKVNYSLSALTTDTSASINSNSSWTVTVDNLAAQSTYYLDPTVYTQQNFPGDINDFSDYNSLLNNVYSNRVSNVYYDVDYSTNLLNPVNFTNIISQSALYAQVQDSNYRSGSVWSKGRYEGVKNTGNYNTSIAFVSKSQAPGYPVDKFSNYFARFTSNISADPEYPGGGLFKLVELISIDGTRIPLTGDNKYVSFVSEVFKAGKTVTAYGRDISVIKTAVNLTIIEGGALYSTVLTVTGSSSPIVISETTSGNGEAFEIYFSTSSINTLTDEDYYLSYNRSWIYSFTNPSSSEGIIDYFYFTSSLGPHTGVSFYNKNTGEYTNYATPTPIINYTDTYLPLQYGDLIRFGKLGKYKPNNTSSLDGTFNAGGLFQILNITTGSDNNITSSINITPILSQYPFSKEVALTSKNLQNFRILRRVPDETYLTTTTNPTINTDPAIGGLLIPEDFNPNYDPIIVARQAGIEL